ncbi:MAG: hypothetical protein KDB86_12535 [Actinobacteria bacterium]|nr:hypothetical protein [Actinomycetota bacterium]MCB9389059.1 hypothetical protein [Acidimicrobiia bacterium]
MHSLRTLKGAGAVFMAAWWIHSIDHMRRGVSASPDGVIWSGTFVAMLAVISLTLIFTEQKSAALFAAIVFPLVGVGVLLSHLPPDWGPLSDPIIFDSNTDGWSIVAVMTEVLAAFWLGYVAAKAVRSEQLSSVSAGPVS